jgi:hypothetical protein
LLQSAFKYHLPVRNAEKAVAVQWLPRLPALTLAADKQADWELCITSFEMLVVVPFLAPILGYLTYLPA